MCTYRTAAVASRLQAGSRPVQMVAGDRLVVEHRRVARTAAALSSLSDRTLPTSASSAARSSAVAAGSQKAGLMSTPPSGMRHGHFTTGGSEERIASTLPPVLRPNTVPRS